MKKMIKNLWDYINGINGLLIILYVIFILSTHIITGKYFSSYHFLIYFILITLFSIFICPFITGFLSDKKIRHDEICNNIFKNLLLRKFIFFIVPFGIFLIYYFAYYPGGFSPDSIDQYQQAVKNSYNDTHPAMQTLFTFKLPLTLSGGWTGSIVLFQIVCFSVVLCYSFEVIFQYTGIKYTLFSIVFIVFNPQTGNITMYPWKDISFAMGTMLLLSYSLQIYLTKGKWIHKWSNTVAFSIVWVLTTLFRHNAVLFTVPILFAVLLCLNKKRILIIVLSVILMVVGIKVPLYSVLSVEKPGERQVETLGLPMTVIGAVITYRPELADEETKEFAYKVAPKEVWNENYVFGSYNSVKWNDKTNNNIIEEYGTQKIITMMFNCFKNAPATALKSLIELTKAPYTISDKYNFIIFPGIAENKCGIVSENNLNLMNICNGYSEFVSDKFYDLFMSLGMMHLILILSVLSKCKLSKFSDWKKIFFILPVFFYNFGTTLLLTGIEDSVRFFFYTFLLIPLLLIFIYRTDEVKE